MISSSSSPAGRILLAQEIRSHRDALVADATKGIEILSQLFADGPLQLTTDVELLLSSICRSAGVPAVRMLLKNLPSVRPSSTSSASPASLAGILLDYFPDPATARELIAWHRPLATHKTVRNHVAIQGKDDVVFYAEVIRGLVSASSFNQGVANELLIALATASPEALGDVIDNLGTLPGRNDLTDFLLYVFEHRIGLGQLFMRLPMLGKLVMNPGRLTEQVLLVYPERKIEALFALCGAQSGSMLTLEPVLERALQSMSLAEVSRASTGLDQVYQGAFWPRRTIIALCSNPALPLEVFFDAVRFPRLCVHSLKYFDAFLENCALRNDGTRRVDVIAAVIESPVFATLDTITIRSIISSLLSLAGTEDCSALQYQILEKSDLKNATIFYGHFFELLRSHPPSTDTARRLLNKITLFGRYPFDDIDFLVMLLAAVDVPTFTSFMLASSPKIFASHYAREKLLLLLAENDIHHFSYLYFQRRKSLTAGIPKYSPALKEMYRTIWKHLSFGEKIKGFLSLR